jgi:ATP-dependent RNA helicase DHX37/DHR1
MVDEDTSMANNESDDDDDDEADDSEEEEESNRPPREKGAFQAWAEAQVLVAAGHAAPVETNNSAPYDVYVPLVPAGAGKGFQALPDPNGITGPLGAVLSVSQLPTLPPQKTTYIEIVRTEEMDNQRKELPIVKEEDRIMEAIRGNAVIVLCGETGSGKTTQIGQFLWEAGWGDASSGVFAFALSLYDYDYVESNR